MAARASICTKVGDSEGLTAFAHVAELSALATSFKLTKTEQIIADLNLDQWMILHLRGSIAVTPKLVLIARGNEAEHSLQDDSIAYDVFSTSTWNDFLKHEAVIAKPLEQVQPGDNSTMSWAIDENAWQKRRQHMQVALTGGFLGLGIAILWMLLVFVRFRRQDFERRLLHLQILSHELRTPITSMRLNLEAMQQSYDIFPPPIQIAYARMLQAEARLSRVLDASKTYLQATAQSLVFDFTRCSDFAHFVQELLNDYGDRVIWVPPALRIEIEIDHYWFGFCLHNLIRNALNHGQPPIRVGISQKNEHIGVYIEDQGFLSEDDYQKMQAPYQQRKGSSGLGLGLTLVQKIARAMGGKIEFHANPTTFTLWMPSRREISI